MDNVQTFMSIMRLTRLPQVTDNLVTSCCKSSRPCNNTQACAGRLHELKWYISASEILTLVLEDCDMSVKVVVHRNQQETPPRADDHWAVVGS